MGGDCPCRGRGRSKALERYNEENVVLEVYCCSSDCVAKLNASLLLSGGSEQITPKDISIHLNSRGKNGKPKMQGNKVSRLGFELRTDPLHWTCEACGNKDEEATGTIQCDKCDKGFHLGCVHVDQDAPVAADGTPLGDWYCGGCKAKMRIPPPPSGSTALLGKICLDSDETAFDHRGNDCASAWMARSLYYKKIGSRITWLYSMRQLNCGPSGADLGQSDVEMTVEEVTNPKSEYTWRPATSVEKSRCPPNRTHEIFQRQRAAGGQGPNGRSEDRYDVILDAAQIGGVRLANGTNLPVVVAVPAGMTSPAVYDQLEMVNGSNVSDSKDPTFQAHVLLAGATDAGGPVFATFVTAAAAKRAANAAAAPIMSQTAPSPKKSLLVASSASGKNGRSWAELAKKNKKQRH